MTIQDTLTLIKNEKKKRKNLIKIKIVYLFRVTTIVVAKEKFQGFLFVFNYLWYL